ncbi:hypothetical protein [Pararhodobacter sp.]|uniref:terminase small subunit-like protein n=1 Tax=Pararhodobacter sp. TaxID=2127056 RepID=UPI002AFE6D29|nr:hypothetical protein [Pararhodobacter sp.]
MTAKKKRALPVVYSEELAVQICGELATGRSLKSVCSDPGMPAVSAIYTWMNRYPEFKEMYARAKVDGAEALFEEIFEIADDASGDFDAEGNFRSEHVQRSRLRVDVRKWALSKLRPQQYGDRVALDHGGQAENPLTALIMSVQGTAIRPVPTLELKADEEETELAE